MTTRRYGWVPPEALGRPHLGRSTAPRPLDALPPFVLLDHLPEVYDQGAVGSCTAQALAAAVEILAPRVGYAAERPSRRDLYYRERVVEGTMLEDAGAILADGVQALRAGWIPEHRWPHTTWWDSSWCATPPPVDPYTAPRLINAEPLAISVDDIAWELACGHPVVVGLRVTEAWEHLDGDTLPPPEGDSIGGHAVCLVGYDVARAAFRVRNSWGTSWRDGGYAWLPFEWIRLGVCGEAFSLRAIRRVEAPA